MLPPIGQSHAKQTLVDVLGRAVSRPMRAVDLAPRSNGDESRTRAGAHPDFSVGT